MKISKEKLIQDLEDTISNNFKEEVVDWLWNKHCKETNDFMDEVEFENACRDFLKLVVNFVKSARS